MRVPKPRNRNPSEPFQLSPRDLQMMILIWLCDGIMSRRQLEDEFFVGLNKSQARRRLRALYDRVYLNQPHNEQQCLSAPEHIYWLDRRGYEEVAKALNVEPDRNLKKIRTFNPIVLQHHLQVVDIRLKVMGDIKRTSPVNMSRWVTERQFRSWKHRVTYQSLQSEQLEKGVEPDGFFALWWALKPQRQRRVYSFVLELDRGTEDLERIKDKLLSNAAYLDSTLYREALGVQSGRCLMITTGTERAENMRELAHDLKVGWAWYFAPFAAVMREDQNFITSPVWRTTAKEEPVSLIPAHLLPDSKG